MFKLPYSMLPPELLKKVSHKSLSAGQFLASFFPFMGAKLRMAELDIDAREYLAMCFVASSSLFLFIFSFFSVAILISGKGSLLVSLVIALLFALFVFFQEIMFPQVIINRRVKAIEKNLLAAVQDMIIQLSSGIPLFKIMANIAASNYGEISKEFQNAVKEINAGKSQITVLEDMAATNPSIYFRRTIWQLVTGMKSGSDLGDVIKEVTSSLAEGQLIQVQKYGSQLNPLAMFYMLVVIIAPALGMTFLIILSSFISLSEGSIKIVFWGFYAAVCFFQIMFMGIIKSKRPNLLGD